MIDRNKTNAPYSETKDIFDILQFKFKNSKSATEQQIFIFQKKYYKQYSAVDQTTFSTQINEKSVKEALIGIGFQVPYDADIISKIKNTITGNPQLISDALIIETLIQGLAYLVSNEKPQELISNLFTIFTFLLPSIHHRSKIITIFILILKEFSKSTENSVTDEIQNSILIFLKNCEELPPTFSEAFYLYMKKVTKSENIKQKMIGDLFDFTRQLIISKKKNFNSISNDETFLEMIKPLILRLHIKAVDLLHTIATIKTEFNENLSNLFVIMAKGLNGIIKQKSLKTKTIFISQNLTEFPTLGELNEITYDTKFKNIPLFEYNDKEIEKLLNFDACYKISKKFTPKCIQNFLKSLSSCFIGINEEYFNVFLRRIIKSAEKSHHLIFYSDYFSVIVYFSKKIKKNLDDNIVRFLMSTIIFHSTKFTSFNAESSNLYYYLQYSAFSLIINHDQLRNQRIKVLLNFAAKMSPFIYSEILLFLLYKVNLFDLSSIFCNEKQIESFMSVMIQLQSLYSIEKIGSQNCRLARIICFHFFFKLFDEPNSFLTVASIQNFSKGIANFIFEPSMTDLVIEKLESTFSKLHLNLNNLPFFTIIQIFTRIFESCSENIENDQYKKLGVKIVKCIFKIVRENPKIVVVFYPNFLYLLKFFRESQEIDFLDGIFFFLFQALNNIENLEISYEILVNFLNNFLREKNEFSDKIELNFFNLLSGKEIDSIDKLFIIKNSQVIPFFIASFSKFLNFDKILLFFSNICGYSLNNCEACHDGDLDCFLISFMKKENEITYNGHQIVFSFDIQQNFSMVFNVIEKIMAVKTSTFICDQLFQMIIPSSPSYQNFEVEKNLNLIDRIVKENLNEMKPTFELITNKTLCKIVGFTDKHLNNDFAFSFWLKIDVNQIKEVPDEYTILLFEGIEKVQYKIYLKSNLLNIKLTKDKDEMSIRKPIEICESKWNSFLFSQTKIEQHEKPEFRMNLYVNGQFIDRLGTTTFQFNPGNVTVKMGTSSSSSEKFANLKIGQIGPFCFARTIDLTTIETDRNFEQMNKFYYSSAQQVNDQIQSEIKVKYLMNNRNPTNLNEILINYYDLNYLTYMYSKFEMDDTNLLDTFLSIILSLLSSSKYAQENYNSVTFLGKTIAKLFNSKLNYYLFTKLFAEFEKMSSQNLVTKFFESIIVNMNLWCQADTSSIVHIIDHLKKEINGHFTSLFNHCCSMSKLLTIYRLSFFPETTTNESTDEETVYPFNLHHKPPELKEIKEEFFQFIVRKGQLSLNCQDIQNIYSHLFASHNRSEKIDILNLLSKLNQSISNVKNIQFDLISPLFKLLNSNDMTIIVSTIMTIKNVSYENVHLIFSIISISLIKYSNISPLFEKLLKMAESEVDLYSLVCSLSLLMGRKKMQMSIDLLQKIGLNGPNNQPALDSCCIWSVWPICIALRGGPTEKTIVSDFLCKQVVRFGELIHHYLNIYYLIDFLSQNDKSSSFELQKIFTLKLLNVIFTTQRADIELHKLDFLLISFASVFFCFQNKNERNRPLINLYHRSQFRDKSKSSSSLSHELNNNNINLDSFKGSPRNFDEIYYSWNSLKIQVNEKVTRKFAKDFSGVKQAKQENWYKTESDEIIRKRSGFKYLYNTSSSESEYENENDNEIIDLDNDEKLPCKSFRDLLNIHQNLININQNVDFEKNKIVFQIKINDNKKWVDIDLSDEIIKYSDKFFDDNPNLKQNNNIFSIFERFKYIVDFLKNREINPINENVFISLEKNIVFIQNNLKNRIDPDNKINPDALIGLLNKAIEKAVSVMKYDNEPLFSSVDETYKLNFECEINRLNNERIELFESLRSIHKKFIRCRDSSIFLENNKINKEIKNKCNKDYDDGSEDFIINSKNNEINNENDENTNNKNNNDSINNESSNNNNNEDSTNNNKNEKAYNNNEDDFASNEKENINLNTNDNDINNINNNNNNNEDDTNNNKNEKTYNNNEDDFASNEKENKNLNTNNDNDSNNTNNNNSENTDKHDDNIESSLNNNAKFSDVILSTDENIKKITNKNDIDEILSYADNNRKFIYKRDNCLCYGFCPIKIRPLHIFKLKEAKLLNVSKIIQKVGIQNEAPKNSSCSSSLTSLLNDSKSSNEIIQVSNDFSCKLVKIEGEKTAKLSFLNDQFNLMILASGKIVTIHYRLVRNVFRRKRYQKDSAVEIILINGKSYLIDFERETISSQFFSKIRKINFPLSKTKIFDQPIDFAEKNRKITQLWENGFLSNFSYLLTINMISGRSFNDVTMYPIFPLILKGSKRRLSTSLSDSSISSSFLDIGGEVKSPISDDLSSDSDTENEVKKVVQQKGDVIVRDLTKNVKSNDAELKTIQEFNLDLINIEIDSMFNPSPLPPDVIDRFMMRIEPFTSLHLGKQSYKFNEKLIFNCIESIEKEKCEIIPEFFFFPEFLMNLNELPVSDFSFPHFKSNLQSPFEFVYRHRKILESKKVSDKLNTWIDLVFGIKQHEFNYHPAIFEEIWNSKSSTLSTAEEKVKSMMRLYGVMPSQLFVRPHSKRLVRPNLANVYLQATRQAISIANRTKSVNIGGLASFPSSLPHRSNVTKYRQKKRPVKKFNEIQRNFSALNLNSNLNESLTFSEEMMIDKKEIFKHNLKCSAMIHLACSSLQNEEFFVIDKDGNDFSIQIMMNKFDHYEKIEGINGQKEKNYWKSVTHLCLIENGFVIVTSSSDDICIENQRSTTNLKNMNKDVNFIESSQNYFAIVQNKTIISIFDTISPYRDGQIVSIDSTIVDCKIDQSFGLVVFLSSNGVLHFHSIHNACKVNAVDLKKFCPKKIIVSSKWGFVLVNCLNRILIFDVNGLFIKEVEFNYNIKYWVCIRSYKDFDFVVFESDKEEIGMFEAFNPQSTIQILTQVNSPVCSIDFFKDQNCIAVLTKQGELVIISNSFFRS